MFNASFSILNSNGEIVRKGVNYFKCALKLLKFQKTFFENNQTLAFHYRLPFSVNQTNLDIFFDSAEKEKTGDDLKSILTLINVFDFYNLSKEFEYTDFEGQIKSFIENYHFQAGEVKLISNFESLDQSFFDNLISFHINSLLENMPNDFDEIPSLRLFRIFSKSNFSNMTVLCKYLIHRYQYHLQLNLNDEIDIDISLFLFVDASNLPEDVIKDLLPISHNPHFQMPQLISRIYQLFESANQQINQSVDNEQKESYQQAAFHESQLNENDKSLNSHFEDVNEPDEFVTNEDIVIDNSKQPSTIITKSSLSRYCSCTFNISANILCIEDSAFSQCSNLKRISVESSNEQFISQEGILFTKKMDKLICFPSKHPLSEYTIPSSVTSIGNSAFANCSNLTTITIPSSVTLIGNKAFSGCNNLRSITVNSNNLQYESHEGILFTKNQKTIICFPSKYQLTDYTIPTSVTSIGDCAFDQCSKLSSVTIPTDVTSIGDCAFYKCPKLSAVTIPANVTSIGSSAFSGCSKLASITIPAKVASIGDLAFYDCSVLTSIAVESRNAHYASCDGVLCNSDLDVLLCFPSKHRLTKYTIPKTITSIGNYAFSYCSSLIEIKIPTSVISIGKDAFSHCSKLKSIAIPGSVASISSYAFSYCPKLSSITISSGVKSIGYYAFYGCASITSITIPITVTAIANSSFSNCSNLASANIPSTFRHRIDHIFPSCGKLKSITYSENR